MTFAQQNANNEVDETLLEEARREWRDCVSFYIDRGDIDTILLNFDGGEQDEQLRAVIRDVAERVYAAADPRRVGYSNEDITFDLDVVYSWVHERMAEHVLARKLNFKFGHGQRQFRPVKSGYAKFTIEGLDKSIPAAPDDRMAFSVQLVPSDLDLSDNAGYYGHTLSVFGHTWKVVWLS